MPIKTKIPQVNNSKELITFLKFLIKTKVDIAYVTLNDFYDYDQYDIFDCHKQIRKTKNMFKNKHASGLMIMEQDIQDSEYYGDLNIISTSDFKGVRYQELIPVDIRFLKDINLNIFINEILSFKEPKEALFENGYQTKYISQFPDIVNSNNNHEVLSLPASKFKFCRENQHLFISILRLFLAHNENSITEIIYSKDSHASKNLKY